MVKDSIALQNDNSCKLHDIDIMEAEILLRAQIGDEVFYQDFKEVTEPDQEIVYFDAEEERRIVLDLLQPELRNNSFDSEDFYSHNQSPY